ncbi:MAG: hypothetical protein ACP5M9_03610 [Candidatus Micrarchaeia archaeon]
MDKNIWSGKTKIVLYISFLIGILGSALLPFANAQSNPQQNAVTALCSVISTVSFVLTILALMLFILGGTLYAFAHFLPATGSFRGNMQGWGMGMLMGGIISLILYILAPFIISTVVSINPSGTSGYLGQPSLTGQVCTNTNTGGTYPGGSAAQITT